MGTVRGVTPSLRHTFTLSPGFRLWSRIAFLDRQTRWQLTPISQRLSTVPVRQKYESQFVAPGSAMLSYRYLRDDGPVWFSLGLFSRGSAAHPAQENQTRRRVRAAPHAKFMEHLMPTEVRQKTNIRTVMPPSLSKLCWMRWRGGRRLSKGKIRVKRNVTLTELLFPPLPFHQTLAQPHWVSASSQRKKAFVKDERRGYLKPWMIILWYQFKHCT